MADDKPDIKVTDLPMNMAEGMWTTVHADFHADPAVVPLRLAHSGVRVALESVVRAHRAIMADPTHTPDANLARSSEAAYRRQTQALQQVDAALSRAKAELDAIDEAMNRPVDPPAPHLIQTMAVQMRSMPDAERTKIISDAMARDDRATLGAVLFAGPAWLYGMTESQRDVLLAQYRQTRFPAALARKAAIEKGISITQASGTAMIEATSKLIDTRKAKRAEELAAVARSALS